MVKRLEVRGKRVRPMSPTRTSLIHLAVGNIIVGTNIVTVCGRSITVLPGGRLETLASWDTAPDSIRCRTCSTSLEQNGKVIEK